MSDSLMDSIWAKYTISPESGMSTLRDTCVALLNHPLSSSDLVPALVGVAFHPRLAEPLREVIPALKHLLYAATQHSEALFDYDHSDFRLATILGLRAEEVAGAWGRLKQKLASIMKCIEHICERHPRHCTPQAPSALPSFAVKSSHPSSPACTAPTDLGESHCSLYTPAPRSSLTSAPRKDFHSRQTDCTVEEFLDNGTVNRAEGVKTAKSCDVERSTATHELYSGHTHRRSGGLGEDLAEIGTSIVVEQLEAPSALKLCVDTGHKDTGVSGKSEESTSRRTEVEACVAGAAVAFARAQPIVIDAGEALRKSPRAAERAVHLEFKLARAPKTSVMAGHISQGARHMSENSRNGHTEAPLEYQTRSRTLESVNACAHVLSGRSGIGGMLGAESLTAEAGVLQVRGEKSAQGSEEAGARSSLTDDTISASADAEERLPSPAREAIECVALWQLCSPEVEDDQTPCLKSSAMESGRSEEKSGNSLHILDPLASSPSVDSLHSDPVCKLGIMRAPIHSQGPTREFAAKRSGCCAVKSERRKESMDEFSKESCEDDSLETYSGTDKEDSGASMDHQGGDGAAVAVNTSAAPESDRGERNVDTHGDVDEPGAKPGELKGHSGTSNELSKDSQGEPPLTSKESSYSLAPSIPAHERARDRAKAARACDSSAALTYAGAELLACTRTPSLSFADVVNKSAPTEPGGLKKSPGLSRDLHQGDALAKDGGLKEKEVKSAHSSEDPRANGRTLGIFTTPFSMLKSSVFAANLDAFDSDSHPARVLSPGYPEAVPSATRTAALLRLDGVDLAVAKAFVPARLQQSDLTNVGSVYGSLAESGGQKKKADESGKESRKTDAPKMFSSTNEDRRVSNSASESAVPAAGVPMNHQAVDTYLAVDISAASVPGRGERDVDMGAQRDDPGVENGGLKESLNQFSKGSSENDAPTSTMAASTASKIPRSIVRSHVHALHPNPDSPHPRSVILPAIFLSKIFALDSAIIRTGKFSYLGARSLVGERTPYRAGMGARRYRNGLLEASK
ncbi:hypothetical protein B0H11DRAFT_2225289 [Mycena galericulata]|nr:hypothetical protein B0H11DRAFT_2225289 [Mycena galericulata]